MKHALRLARFVAPYRLKIAVALFALAIAAGCVLALGQGLKYVIDKGFGSANTELLNAALVAMIGVAALLSVATFTRFLLMMSLGERVVADLRRTVFNHILALEPGYFEATRTGEVISRLTNDTSLLLQVIGSGLSMFVRNLLMMLGAAVMMFVVSWKLALFVLLGNPGHAGCRSCCSAGACGACRATTRTGSPTCRPTWTKRCTKSAPCRPTPMKGQIERPSRHTPKLPTAPASRASARRRS